MTEALDPLRTALADRYRIERELGRGGMATVYLAEDLKLHRRVALKVLLPELAAVLGVDRFQREVEITARLHHPHAVPVFDSGEAADRLWYTMPYVEGESLGARIARERQLPLAEVSRIATQVAAALDEAHRHGIVHRDIKPENILLTPSGDALVSDFGIAKLVAAGPGQGLTADGLAVGTPQYMSPEQSTGERALDARSDEYALACVVFEMLAGEPPFTGATFQNIVAKRLADPPPSVRTLRPAVPAAWDAALLRALAVAPADRFPAAGDFAAALTEAGSDGTGRAPGRRAGAPLAKRRVPVLAVGALAVLLLVGGLVLRGRARLAALDRGLVAVFPFRVATSDTSLRYLAAGMVDLLAVKFSGDGGPRAVDPRASISAWRRVDGDAATAPADAAERAARIVGAGLLIGDGAVVGDPGRITLTATLADVGARGDAESVSGPLDSLPALVDRLVSQLLAHRAGEQTQQLVGVTTVPALRAYLAGRANNRRGHYLEALHDYDRALDEDSTFALAALGAVKLQTRGGEPRHPVNDIAWANRSRFTPADRAMLFGTLGPRYPELATTLEIRQWFQRATELAPDHADAWFELGDQDLHYGLMNDLDDPLALARSEFRRAIALDSTYNLPLEHLLRTEFESRDTAAIRRVLPLLLAQDTLADWFPTVRWQAAVLLGDSATVRAVRARFPSTNRVALGWIVSAGQVGGLAPADAERALRLIVATDTRPADLAGDRQELESLLNNLGRPTEAAATALVRVPGAPTLPPFRRAIPLFEWLLNDGDSAAGRRAESALAALARDRAQGVDDRAQAQCFLGIAAGLRRDRDGLSKALGQLHPLPPRADRSAADNVLYCLDLLAAWRSALEGRGEARRELARADSVLLVSAMDIWEIGNLLDAVVAALAGDLDLARRAARRELVQVPVRRLFYAAYLRERGRFALLAGDTTAARRWWREYLALRAHPEPAAAAAVDAVRDALARLK